MGLSDSSTKDSRGWVQLGRSPTGLGKDSDSLTIERGGSGQVSIHNPETKESNDIFLIDQLIVYGGINSLSTVSPA